MMVPPHDEAIVNKSVNLQPHLQGDLVILRPLVAADWDALFAVASDPLIWEQHPASDRYKEEVFREYFREALQEAELGTGGAFAIIDRADNRIIGSSRYHGYDAQRSEIEIGWTFLSRSHWGGRYNSEVKRIMLAHVFQYVDRVIFLVGVSNIRSQKAMERIGGRYDGTIAKPDRHGNLPMSIRYVVDKPR
ncbi:MAG TPA: GNAT family N-acetyltransferase [Phycisphaerales bacterium]|nr:GNAT family N-acetyltransferase [Phycisphaerales bacterium]HRQ74684.1 GNAT family N-acetyltransferase [Phycisphaerales bacterium]